MYNYKKCQIIKFFLLAIAAIPLIWLSHGEYQGKPFTQTKDIVSYLVEVTVLINTVFKQKDSDQN